MRPIGRRLWPHARGLLCFALVVTVSVPLATSGEPPGAVRHVVVYREEGRFAGWPANHGIWAWGDEILVGFSRGERVNWAAGYSCVSTNLIRVNVFESKRILCHIRAVRKMADAIIIILAQAGELVAGISPGRIDRIGIIIGFT